MYTATVYMALLTTALTVTGSTQFMVVVTAFQIVWLPCRQLLPIVFRIYLYVRIGNASSLSILYDTNVFGMGKVMCIGQCAAQLDASLINQWDVAMSFALTTTLHFTLCPQLRLNDRSVWLQQHWNRSTMPNNGGESQRYINGLYPSWLDNSLWRYPSVRWTHLLVLPFTVVLSLW